MIYIQIDDIVKAKFFMVFSASTEVTYLTNKVSCYLYLKANTQSEIIFLKREVGKLENDIDVDLEKLSKTIAVLNRRQTIESAVLNYKDMMRGLQNKLDGSINKNDLLIVFNGNHASAIAAYDYFKKFNAKTLFSEISNLPGKMIFDPCGVNAQSILYSNPKVLESFDSVTDLEHDEWLSSYIKYKENPIPQSKIKISIYLIVAFDDLIARCFNRVIKEDTLKFRKKINMFFDKFKSKKIMSGNLHADLNKRYVFFPTQVTSDTQLKINSKVDNIDAVEKIIIDHPHDQIYVKIHPAESDLNTISHFTSLAREGKITLVNNNTVELIKNADLIYTINSTVGLESLILGKEVIVLGKAIYSAFDTEMLKKYIHSYLIDFDYFSKNEFEASHLVKLTKLSEL